MRSLRYPGPGFPDRRCLYRTEPARPRRSGNRRTARYRRCTRWRRLGPSSRSVPRRRRFLSVLPASARSRPAISRSVEVGENGENGAFQSCRGGQASAFRNIRCQHQISSTDPMTGFLKGPDHARDIGLPTCHPWLQVGVMKDLGRVIVKRGDPPGAIVGWSCRNHDSLGEGERHARSRRCSRCVRRSG